MDVRKCFIKRIPALIELILNKFMILNHCRWRDCRVNDNWALIYAIQEVQKRNVGNLSVIVSLPSTYMEYTRRQMDFFIDVSTAYYICFPNCYVSEYFCIILFLSSHLNSLFLNRVCVKLMKSCDR